jgi:hypothetical protein
MKNGLLTLALSWNQSAPADATSCGSPVERREVRATPPDYYWSGPGFADNMAIGFQ